MEVFEHIAKYANVGDFLDRSYRFRWEYVECRFVHCDRVHCDRVHCDQVHNATHDVNVGYDAHEECEFCVIDAISVTLEMYVESCDTSIQFVHAELDDEGNIRKIKFAGVKNGIDRGKVTDDARRHCVEMLERAIPLFGAETIAGILCDEVARFFNVGKFECVVLPVPIPSNRNLSAVDRWNLSADPCRGVWDFAIKNGDRIFTISICDIFGLDDLIEVTMIYRDKGYNTFTDHYISLEGLKEHEYDDGLEVYPPCSDLAFTHIGDITREMVDSSVRGMAIPAVHMDTIINQIMHVVKHPRFAGDVDDAIMTEILGSAYTGRCNW